MIHIKVKPEDSESYWKSLKKAIGTIIDKSRETPDTYLKASDIQAINDLHQLMNKLGINKSPWDWKTEYSVCEEELSIWEDYMCNLCGQDYDDCICFKYYRS